MSYDLHFTLDSGFVETREPHVLRGGTYVIGPTKDAWLNITYNYSKIFDRVFGERGIRSLYGKNAGYLVHLLDEAIPLLNPNTRTENYWDPTEGNARAALCDLRELCKLVPPDSVLVGD